MAIVNLNPGAFPNDPTAETVYQTFVKSQSNFQSINSDLSVLGGQMSEVTNVSLVGITPADEWNMVKDAINQINPGKEIPKGFEAIFTINWPYNEIGTGSFFNRRQYKIKKGAGFYGQGTPPPGVPAITVNPGDIILLGEGLYQAQSREVLGEIGSTPISTAVDSFGTDLTFSGFTIIDYTRSGVPSQSVFEGPDGTYGASSGNTTAETNYILLDPNVRINNGASLRGSAPGKYAVNITLSEEHLYRTNRFDVPGGIVTVPLDSAKAFEVGVWSRFYFKQNGVVNFPLTDGQSSLNTEAGDVIYCEKVDADEWIVKVIAKGANQSLTANGVILYDDLTTQTTPIAVPSSETYVDITNDGAGPNTDKSLSPPGVTDLWNTSTNRFDFSQLSLGDKVDVSLLIDLTTDFNNQEITFRLETGIGGTASQNEFFYNLYSSSGTYPVMLNLWLPMIDDNIRLNPARIQIKSDNSGEVVVNGLSIYVTKN